VLATQRTIVPAHAGRYVRLLSGDPELRVRRDDLTLGSAPSSPKRTVVHLVHVTDQHVVDVQSPGRYEFMERFHGGPTVLRVVLPAYRPHEFLHIHACDAMVRTISRIGGSPITGAPIQCVLSTGDSIDNQQANELSWFLRLMDGGSVHASSGGVRYEGVQAAEWGDPEYWHPDEVEDRFKLELDFPTFPGLLDEAMAPFEAEGMQLPWLACYGNHDALLLGAAHADERMRECLVGSKKATRAPAGFVPDQLSEFVDFPELFLGSPFRDIAPDEARQACTSQEFLSSHGRSTGAPRFHGFDGRNGDEVMYYVYDEIPGVRLIVLDTTNPGGGFEGSVGATQAAWLEERLTEVHSRYLSTAGCSVTTSNDDRIVLIGTHMPSGSLINARVAASSTGGRDEPRVLGPELAAVLHRYPNVVLWLNGHTHRNAVRAHVDPLGRTAGYWEVTTCSLIDWPCECRLVELTENEDRTLSIFCTMVTSDAPLDPEHACGRDRLASLCREIAANDPHAGIEAGLSGGSGDRSIELVIRDPRVHSGYE
jgi:metallophosphoesterase (TIGR03767 family)